MLPPNITLQDLRTLSQTMQARTILGLYPELTADDFMAAEELAETTPKPAPSPTQTAPEVAPAAPLAIDTIAVGKKLLADGFQLVALRPNSKVAFVSGWEKNPICTMDELQTAVAKYGNGLNLGVVAKAEEGRLCIFEIDDSSIVEKIKADIGLDIYQNRCIRSSKGRGHVHFWHSAASVALGNASLDGPDGKELYSFRAHNQYCVAEGCVHPKTGLLYQRIIDLPIQTIPDALVTWIRENRTTEKVSTATPASASEPESAVIREGGRNNYLIHVAGKWRQDGLDEDDILNALRKRNVKKCEPPLPESEVRTIASSAARYPEGEPVPIFSAVGKASFGEGTEQSEVGKILSQGISDLSCKRSQVVVVETIAGLRRLEQTLTGFPKPLTAKSLWGIMGEFVEIGYPLVPSNRELLFYQLLPLLGAWWGKKWYRPFSADQHYASLFTLMVARTSDGKGTCGNHAKMAMAAIDPAWMQSNVRSNVASGEALVRAAVGTGMAGHTTRCALVLPEVSILFNAAGRDGSNLSGMFRSAYDMDMIENFKSSAKNSITATDYILGAVGSITPDELRKVMPAVSWANGFANRFLWCLGYRTKRINTTTLIPDYSRWAAKVKEINYLDTANDRRPIDITPAANEIWENWCNDLDEDGDSQFSQAKGRNKANATRVAVFYAITDTARLDGWQPILDVRHIEAAIEVVERSNQSVAWYLNEQGAGVQGVSTADVMRLSAAMAERVNSGKPAELTATEIHSLFSNRTAQQRNAICAQGGLMLREERTAGRSTILWVPTWVN